MHSLIRIMIILSFAMACDLFNIFYKTELKYAPIILPSIAALSFAVARGFRLNRPRWATWAFLIMFLYALPGLLYNKLSGEPQSLFTAVFLSAVIWCAQLVPLEKLRIDPGQLLRGIERLGFCNLVSVCLTLAILDPTRYNRDLLRLHERAFLVPLSFGVAYLQRRWCAAAAAAALMAVVVYCDPRTTTILAIAMTLVLLVITTLPREIRLPLLAIGVVVVPVISLESYKLMKSVNNSFKVSMGSVDNSEFREDKWAMAIREFHRAPVFGKFFAGPGEYDHRLAHRYNHGGQPEDIDAVPLHNDYLEFLVDGGLVGLGLFTTGLIGCVWLGLKNYVAFERRRMSDPASLSLILSITLITAMLAIAVNPVMNESPCGFFVYLAAALIIVIDRYQTHSSAMARQESNVSRSGRFEHG